MIIQLLWEQMIFENSIICTASITGVGTQSNIDKVVANPSELFIYQSFGYRTLQFCRATSNAVHATCRKCQSGDLRLAQQAAQFYLPNVKPGKPAQQFEVNEYFSN
ncbi:Hypothetical_protein [Hexamita inflata]|uniref:Hypothetical_protein n=1 Tax=Hexamita inflata TaxID=28002 RepID=A0AA86V2S2_9EUKA|nr:Hypothetical protein HINF_LOCUS61577 [Hexamita inflata]